MSKDKFCIIIFLVILFPVKAFSVNMESYSSEMKLGVAKKYYRLGEYKKSLEICKDLADLGVSEAQLQLGYMYMEGKGVQQDNKKAFAYFDEAANNGSDQAMLELGVLYSEGYGSNKDIKKAKKDFAKLITENNWYAMFNLGSLYYQEEKYEDAHLWFSTAYEVSDHPVAKKYANLTRR